MNITSYDDLTEFQKWVIASASSDKAFKSKTGKYHQISITLNGVELDFLEWCNRLDFEFDSAVIKKARELAIEKFNDIMTLSSEFYNTLDEMQKDLETKIRHKMELPTWEERFGE